MKTHVERAAIQDPIMHAQHDAHAAVAQLLKDFMAGHA